MAISPKDAYPGQVDETDPAYPEGKAQNDAVEGDGFGTPLEKDLVNDIFGMQQALLLAADITPSGTPDSATSSQYLQSFYRILGRADGWGALGNDSADDTAALQSALDAISSRGAGRQVFHLVDGRIYRHTGLDVPPNVDIFGHGATLAITHASNAQLTYAEGNSSPGKRYQKIVDITFLATVSSNGPAVAIVDESSRVQVVGAHFGANSNCLGKFIDASDVGGDVRLESVVMHGRGNSQHVHILAGYFSADDVTFIAASGALTLPVVEVGAVAGHIDGATFDMSVHGGSPISCIHVTNSAARLKIGTMEVMSGGAADVCLSWTAAALLVVTGLRASGNNVWYSGTTTLASSSSLNLRAHRSVSFSGAACSLPPGCALVLCRSNEASGNIDLEFPSGHFPGQMLTLSLTTSYGDVTVPDVTGSVPVTHATMVNLTSGYVQSASFVWIDPAGGTSYRWVQTGPWVTVG